MTNSLRRRVTRFIAGTLTLSSVSMVNAAAVNKVSGVLSSNLKPFVGTVLTANEVMTAEQAVTKTKEVQRAQLSTELAINTAESKAQAQAKAAASNIVSKTSGEILAEKKIAEIEAIGAQVEAQAKAEAEKKAKLEAEAKAAEAAAQAAEAEAAQAKAEAQAMAAAAEAKAKDDAEAKATAAKRVAEQQKAENAGFGTIPNPNSVIKPVGSVTNSDTKPSFTPEIDVEHTITGGESSNAPEGGKYMGNYKLTFYCPCEICNGRSDALTASGTVMAEGRTIAVDKSLIPLGSRVYIDGFGTFIAEDTGSAIIGNHIDICVSSHERAYDLGVQYGDVYVLD